MESLDYGCAVDLTPREHFDRYVALVNAGDWDGVRDQNAPDVRVVDRRPIGWGETVGLDAMMAVHEGWSSLSPGYQLSAQLLAAGRHASVARSLFTGVAEDGVEWEIEVVLLTVVESGQSTLVEVFPGDNAESALARFEEIGAQTEPERAIARFCRTVNSRDWDAIEDLFTEDFEVIDHRVLGWEPLRGGRAIADFYRSWDALVPDGELRFEAVAGDDEYAVVRYVGWGHAAEGGGEMEYATTQAVSFRDGRFRRSETFGDDDEALALARFQELRADRR